MAGEINDTRGKLTELGERIRAQREHLGLSVQEAVSYTHLDVYKRQSPSRDVTRDGMPAFYFMDVPPKTTTDLTLGRPELYFGELTNHYVIVNTKEPEFDYPRLDSQAIEPTFYEGNAGIGLNKFLRKLAFMIRFRDYQILVSGALTPDSKMIMNRNIVDRVCLLYTSRCV